jgi:hypothetical protein
MKRHQIDIDEYCEGAILLTGFESAIIGIVNTFEGNRILYDKSNIISILCERDGMTESESEEYFDYNIKGGYFGDLSPVFLDHPIIPIKTNKGFYYEIIS